MQVAWKSAGSEVKPQLIFLVESDADAGWAMQAQLQQVGYAVRWFETPEILRAVEEARPAIVLIEIRLRGWAGLELCRRIRQDANLARTPIICLTGGMSEEDRILGLEAGGDDCVAKTVSAGELVARVQAVLRRFSRSAPRSTLVRFPSVIKLGEMEIDRSAMRISVRGKEVTTTTLEFRLMEHLAQHLGRVFTRDELLDAVWGDTQFVTPRTVDACIRRIREKIEDDSTAPSYLKTVRGAGYRLDLGVEHSSPVGLAARASGAA